MSICTVKVEGEPPCQAKILGRDMCAKHYMRWWRNGHPGRQDRWANEFDGTEYKQCSKCREVKLRSQFHRDKKRRDGLTPQCSACVKANNEALWPLRRDKVRRQEKLRRARRLGLSPEEYDALVDRHNGRCGICQGAPNGIGGLHIDHDHASGKVRGLLCHSCNVSIGHFRDDPDLLRQAAEYIELHRG